MSNERFYDNLAGFSDLKYSSGVLYGRLNGGEYQAIPTKGDDGIDGIDGENAYLYIAYASDDQGTAFSLIPAANLTYIALLQSTTSISSPTAPQFAGKWYKYLGDDGADGADGADGLDSYVYVAYASDAIGTAFNMTPSDSLKYRAEIHVSSPITSPSLSDFSGATWVKYIGNDGDPSAAIATHNSANDAHADLFGAKVDKVTGKQLSTEDYTSAEKSKLSGIAEGAEVNVNADWNATSGDAQILNKPSIPDAQIQSDWNQTTGTAKDFIKNKPTIPTNSSFTLAGLGEKSYTNLTDKPTIPSKTSDLTNDSGFTTDSAVSTGYVAKSTGYSLVADAQITKLGNLPTITSIGTGLSLASGVLSANIDLSGYSVTTHNHDSAYSATGHTHSAYSLTTHTHDYSTVYAALSHTHSGYLSAPSSDSKYYGMYNGAWTQLTYTVLGAAASSHSHSDYSLTTHNHDSAYSAAGHTHSNYSLTSHTHDYTTVFAAISHTHSGYAASSHTHAYSDITGLTASRVVVSDANGKPASSSVTATTLGYLDATSSIQTQLNAKQATITGAATTITTSNLTASRALVSDSSGKVAVSSITATVLGYLANVTSDIQTQINGKSDTGHTHSNYLTDAASDGNEYVRKNGAWSVASGGAALATTSTAGIVQIGTNISVLSGVISVATASTSALGVAQFSSTYFTVSSGTVSIKLASTSVKGVAEFSPSYFSVSSGVVSILGTSTSVTGAVLGASSAEVAAGTSTSYRAFTPAQIKSMVETFASSGVPSGSVLPFAGSGSVPSGFLLCNGAEVSRTTYANLYSAIGTLYGVGNGSTTFNIPDFRGRFLRGYDGTRSTAIGTAQADGLPGLTGSGYTLADTRTSSYPFSGVFSLDSLGGATPTDGTTGYPRRNSQFSFDASRSNSIYGASSYVTPYNYAVQFIIKY